ncbi:hypothetical protein HGRIS_013014 [Hohenbuehelia grisea]|uniref:DAGKc domain-containing protein n=1 Tax=Hohenbuehelia grisea TaxID=104357 RepID=A0ABR3IU23_9AGAR
MSINEVVIRAAASGKLVSFGFTDHALLVKSTDPKLSLEVPHRQVLSAAFAEGNRSLKVSYLAKKKKGCHSLVNYEGEVQDAESQAVVEWVEKVMDAAYEGLGIKRARKLKVLVNPHGGRRKAPIVFTKTVEPILRTAGCVLDVHYTTHGGHAYDIAKELPLEYDAVVTVSGDGLVHEVINGFAHHAKPLLAFKTPIAPIPTGSGNGLALNLLGIEDGLDVAAAALNIVKSQSMKVDIFSITQGGKRTFSFMSQALGLMAELDVGTDHLRWMGEARFTYGLIRGILQFKPCPIQLSVKIAEHDKSRMAEALQEKQRRDDRSVVSAPLPDETSEEESALPSSSISMDDTDGWTTIEEPLLYVYAGKGPYVARDFMAFPVSLPNDGLIDVVAQPASSRGEIFKEMPGAAKGEPYWNVNLKYMKAHAYRVKPLSSKGCLAVDGEVFPFEEFQVEVHPGLATLLSPHGFYAAEFDVRRASKTSANSKPMNEH